MASVTATATKSDVLVTTDWAQSHLNDPNVRLVEVDVDKKAYSEGHIPNAVNLDWNELFDPITKTMKSAAECRAMLVARGVEPEAEIVTY